MLKPIGIALGALLVSVPASAQITFADDPPAAPGANANSKDANRLICQRQEQAGSRLGGQEVCHTKAKWDEIKARERQDLASAQQQNTANGSSH